MSRHRHRALAFVGLGFGLLILAIVYWTNTATALPPLMPGHRAGSHKVHFKYGYVIAAVAAASFVYAWVESVRAAGGVSPQP